MLGIQTVPSKCTNWFKGWRNRQLFVYSNTENRGFVTKRVKFPNVLRFEQGDVRLLAKVHIQIENVTWGHTITYWTCVQLRKYAFKNSNILEGGKREHGNLRWSGLMEIKMATAKNPSAREAWILNMKKNHKRWRNQVKRWNEHRWHGLSLGCLRHNFKKRKIEKIFSKWLNMILFVVPEPKSLLYKCDIKSFQTHILLGWKQIGNWLENWFFWIEMENWDLWKHFRVIQCRKKCLKRFCCYKNIWQFWKRQSDQKW